MLLTAAHFHHAGFTLPLMAGLNAKAQPGCWTRFSCVAILVVCRWWRDHLHTFWRAEVRGAVRSDGLALGALGVESEFRIGARNKALSEHHLAATPGFRIFIRIGKLV